MVGFKVIIFALTLISYTTWVQANDITNHLGILGGCSVSNEPIQAPYVVGLYQNGNIIGTGSIVHEQFILTSASVVARANDTLRVQTVSSGCGHFIEVDQPLCHENYTKNQNDICLLKLSGPVTVWPNVAKVNLPNNDLPLEDKLIVNVTGWGETQNGSHPDQLQQNHVRLVSHTVCREYFSGMNNNKICADARGDLCWGNSGAPMTYNNVQIGVASLHYHYRCSEYPTIFTKVSKYMKWIKTKISNNS